MFKALVTLALLVNGTNFIDNSTALPGTKVNVGPVVGPANQNLSASEFNTTIQGLYDVRTVIERKPSIWSFGAVGDGSTDDSGAITSACSSGATVVSLTAGSFKMASNITVPAGCTLQFENGAMLSIPSGVTVTFNQNPIAGAYQIFSGTGVQPVSFGNAVPNPALVKGVGFNANVAWWGAVGDGVTDARAKIQQGVYAFGYNTNPILGAQNQNPGAGGFLNFNGGNYIVNGSLVFGIGASGLTVQGIGAQGNNQSGTTIQCTGSSHQGCVILAGEQYAYSDGGVVATTDVTNIQFKNMMIWSTVNAGETVSIGEIGGASQVFFDNVSFLNYDITHNMIGMATFATPTYIIGGNLEGIAFTHCIFSSGLNMSVPMINMVGTGFQLDGGIGGGQVADVSFKENVFNGSLTSTAEFFHIENADQTGYGLANILFEQARLEVPYSGGWKILGGQQVHIQNVEAGDTAQTQSAPLIYYAPENNAPPTLSIEQFWTDMGSAAIPTIVGGFQNGVAAGFVTIRDSQVPWIAPSSYGSVIEFNSQGNGIADAGFGLIIPMRIGGVGETGDGGVGESNWGISGLPGISATRVPAYNLRGTLSILMGSTTGSVTFTNPEIDALYFLSVTPTSGDVAADAITGIGKNKTGFTVTIAANATNDIVYDWIMVR